MLISEEIEPVAIAIIELRLSEGISQSVSRSVGRLVSQSAKNSVEKFKNFILSWW